MRTSEMFPSRFLKESDIDEVGKVFTIKRIILEEVGRGQQKEEKPVIYFQETDKCMTLNKTNSKRMEKMFKADDTDLWIGKQCVVFWDPDIEFGGDIIGGIRVRSVKSSSTDDTKLLF
jgi:hypothetical protein